VGFASALTRDGSIVRKLIVLVCGPVSACNFFFECFILTNTQLSYAVTLLLFNWLFNYMFQKLFLLHWQG
jgi:hypothetical protein